MPARETQQSPNRAKLRDRIVDVLSDLYQKWHSAKFFLEDAGVPVKRVVSWEGLSPLEYWTAVGQLVDSGIIGPDGLSALVLTALKDDHYPGNESLLQIRAALNQLNAGKPLASARALKLLFLAANPVDMPPVRTGRELRAIEECLNHPGLPVRIEPKHFMAVEPGRILDAIVREQPDLVHFSGHGQEDGAIALESQDGERVLIQADRLAKLFEEVNQPMDRPRIRCVILSACRSKKAADGISKSVDVVVGTDHDIGDEAAIAFAKGFYVGLTDNRSIGNSIGLGKVQMDLVAGGGAKNLHGASGGSEVDPESSERIIVASRKGVKPDQLFLGLTNG